jgi:hypothetical protein
MQFEGSLRMKGEKSPGVAVTIDLQRGRLAIHTPGGELGVWSLDDVGVRGEDDGFHLRVEGEEVVLTTSDDPGFALAIGLTAASPRLRRRIGAALRPS